MRRSIRSSGRGATRLLRAWPCLVAAAFFWSQSAPAAETILTGETVISNGEAVSFNVLGAPLAERLNVAFGDSFTAGIGASTPALGYAARVGAALGWDLTVKGLPGRQIQDIVGTEIAATVVTPGSRFLTLTGLNDLRYYGTDAAALDTYRRTLRAGLAWLALPHAEKRFADDPAITWSGPWTNTTLSSGSQRARTTSAAGATGRVTLTGRAIYLAYTSRAALGNGGRFTVAIDGAVRATIDTAAGVGSGQPLVTSWPELLRIGGLTDEPHEVIITTLAPGAPVQIEWLASNAGAAGFALPLVLAGNTPRLSAAGYTASANAAYNRGSDTANQLYNATHEQVCAELLADGWRIQRVDLAAGFDPGLAAHFAADRLHPSDLGHARLASIFLTGASAAAQHWGLAAVDPGATAARVTTLTTPTHGTLTARGDTLTYTPGASYFGRDTAGCAIVYPARTATAPPGFIEPAPIQLTFPVRNDRPLFRIVAESATPLPAPTTPATAPTPTYGPVRSREAGVFLGSVQTGRISVPALFSADGRALLASGDPAPDLPAARIETLGPPSGAAAPATLKLDRTAGVTTANRRVLFTALDTATPRLAVREGDAFTNAPTTRLVRLLSFDGAGDTIFFLARVQPAGGRAALALGAAPPAGTRLLLARVGDSIGDRRIATLATLTGAAGSLAHSRWRTGDDRLAARLTFTDATSALYEIPATATSTAEWTRLIGTGEAVVGETIAALGLPAFATGNVATAIRLAGRSRETAILSAPAGLAPRLLARRSGPVPGAEGQPLAGARFASFRDPIAASGGRVAFLATLADGPLGLWSATGDALQLLARTGGAAPGGGRWASLDSVAWPDAAAGPFFSGRVTGALPGTEARLWHVDRTGAVRLLLGAGQTLPLREGLSPIVRFDAASVAAGSIGSAHGYDAAGILAVVAHFERGRSALIRIALP